MVNLHVIAVVKRVLYISVFFNRYTREIGIKHIYIYGNNDILATVSRNCNDNENPLRPLDEPNV